MLSTKLIEVAAGLASGLILIGCAPCASLADDPALAEIQLLDRASPERALNAALLRGDKRFLGIGGFSLTAPGIGDGFDDEVYFKYGVRQIEGTGDAGVDSKTEKLISQAREYATTYNRLLLKSLHLSPATQEAIP